MKMLLFRRTHFEKQGLNIFFFIPQMSSCCFHTSKINSLGQNPSPTYLCKYCFIYFRHFFVAEKTEANVILFLTRYTFLSCGCIKGLLLRFTPELQKLLTDLSKYESSLVSGFALNAMDLLVEMLR